VGGRPREDAREGEGADPRTRCPRGRAPSHEYGGGGRYTEIDPPTRLAFTWIWDGDDRRQLIELDFEEVDGVTTVRFTHSGLWDEEAVRSHEGGWGKAFDNLERALARSHPPG
jgi:uncharacterized protein YndB with AHSA1/START domain